MRQLFTAPRMLIGILLLTAMLRLVHLGAESLWMDEIISVAIARLDWGTFWSLVSRFEANMVLYYGLLHFWMKLGDSEAVIRGLSALTGFLTVPLLYVLTKRMFSTRAALIGALLLAVNAFHIRFSQEARAYTLVVFLTTLSSLFFIQAIERNFLTDWAGFVVAGTLAVYSHFFAVLILGAQLVSLILIPPKDVPWRRLLISVSVMAFLLLPVANFVLTRDQGQLGSVPKLRPSDVYGLFESFAGGGKLLVLAYFVPSLIACVCALQAWSRSRLSKEVWRYGFFLSWLLVPILTGLAVSIFKPLLVARYFIICLPALVILVAVGVASINSGWVRAASLVVLVALAGQSVLFYYSHPEKEDWREATRYVASQSSQKDGILFYIETGRLGFDYYVRRLGPGVQAWNIVFPDHFDWGGDTAEAGPVESVLATLPQRYERVWIFLSHDKTQTRQQEAASIDASLTNKYKDVKEKKFQGIRVLLFSARAQAR
jgi:mannosyltransferase